MRILVLASESVSAELLHATVGEDAETAEVLIVAPALTESALRFWLSDADDAIRRAETVQRNSVRGLDNADVDATGDTGESDPLTAIDDALTTFEADRIVVFRHRDDELAFREDGLLADLEARFARPVEIHVIDKP